MMTSDSRTLYEDLGEGQPRQTNVLKDENVLAILEVAGF